MVTKTFNNHTDAIQFAFSEIEKLHRDNAELQGRLYGQRFALQTLAQTLSHEGVVSSAMVSAMTDKMADIVEARLGQIENEVTRRQFEAAVVEMREVSVSLKDPGKPNFSVIDGDKP